MKWLKRSLVSIIRRPGKSFLLFIVVWVMFSLLAGALSIISTADYVKAEIKRGLGATAFISVDNQYMPEEDYDTTFQTFIEGSTALCESSMVDYGEIHLTADGYAHSYDVNKDFDVIYHGISMADTQQFRDKEWALTSQDHNRSFSSDELMNGASVAIVNINMATARMPDGEVLTTGLTRLGNIITLKVDIPYVVKIINNRKTYHYYTYEFDVEVIGTYTDTLSEKKSILLPHKLLINVMQDASNQARSEGITVDTIGQYPKISYAGFKLKDTNQLSDFDAQAKQLMTHLPSCFDYESSGTSYERNAGPIENLDMIAWIILIASLIATVLILGLIIIFLISERKKEVGIYMSLGEKTHHLIYQILVEIIIISTLAIGCASMSGFYLGNQLSDYMMQVQNYVKREQDLGNRVYYTPYNKNDLEEYSRENIVENYQNELTGDYILTLYGIGEVTILISCIAPLVYMTRLKPKDIMIGGA